MSWMDCLLSFMPPSSSIVGEDGKVATSEILCKALISLPQIWGGSYSPSDSTRQIWGVPCGCWSRLLFSQGLHALAAVPQASFFADRTIAHVDCWCKRLSNGNSNILGTIYIGWNMQVTFNDCRFRLGSTRQIAGAVNRLSFLNKFTLLISLAFLGWISGLPSDCTDKMRVK